MSHIRFLRPDELPRLAAVFQEDPEPEVPSVVLAADDPSDGLLGWGALCNQLHGNPMPPGRQFLHLAVRPDARGHGVGRLLASELLRLAAESGTGSLAASAAIVGLNRKLGYRIRGRMQYLLR